MNAAETRQMLESVLCMARGAVHAAGLKMTDTTS